MKRLTAEWVRKAEADYRTAATLSRGSEPFHDQLCFHCQQRQRKVEGIFVGHVIMAIKVTKYVHSSSRWSDWFQYCVAYLNAAEVLLRQLSTEPTAETTEEPWHLLPSAAPAIYCLRHSVELVLKFVACALEQPLQKTHNPQILFSALRGPLSNIDESDVAWAAEAIRQEPAFVSQWLDTGTEEVEKVVHKYYSYSFLKEPGPIEDDQNELFRYPVTLADGAAFAPHEVHQTLDVAQALTDVKTLQTFIWCLVIAFGTVKDGRTFLEACEAEPTAQATKHPSHGR